MDSVGSRAMEMKDFQVGRLINDRWGRSRIREVKIIGVSVPLRLCQKYGCYGSERIEPEQETENFSGAF